MNEIKKSGSTFSLDCFPWAKDYPACPKTSVTLSWNEEGIAVHFVSYETNLRAIETEHNAPVCQDSCMEMFMQYAPKTDARYINLEINPNCAVYAAIRYDRARREMIDPADIELLGVRSAIFEDRWELDFCVPVAFLQKYVPTYEHKAGAPLRGNFYKCGDLTDHPHYGCFANVGVPQPDYHRPEFFADFVLMED